MTDSQNFEAAYLQLYRSGELSARAHRAREHHRNCDLCARGVSPRKFPRHLPELDGSVLPCYRAEEYPPLDKG